MGAVAKVLGLVCAAYGVYIIFIFVIFTLDFKHDLPIFSSFPSVNDNYDKPFYFHGFVRMLFWIIIWGIHHSLFARSWMAKMVANVITPKLERSLYVFISAIVLDWMMYDDEIKFGGGILWSIKPWNESNFFIRNGLTIIGTLYFSTSIFQLGGLSLFGIPQSFEWNERKITDSGDATSPRIQHHSNLVRSGLYAIVRHPLQTGFLFALWLTPFMTLQKFIYSALLTTYIIVGINLEEKGCINMFGDEYRVYQQEVPQLIPFVNFCPFGRKHKST